ncbi:MAG: M14 family zinc carboxypeptidase [Candidatus Neomarinimicrobiota bacterium]|nr:MAG: T9SS type A sorting domain-containing protein [bacterium]
MRFPLRNLLLINFLIIFINAQSLDPRYHSYFEIESFLDSLTQVNDFDSEFRVYQIGYSEMEELPIYAVKISDNVEFKEDEPRVLFVGQLHAEEILGVEAVLELILLMLDPPPEQIQHMNIIKQNIETWIIPTLNPEGLNVVHNGLDISFRKNKKDFSPLGPWPNNYFDYDSAVGEDIDGVDLNRNFDFNWVFGDTFMEPDPSDYAAHYDYYRGLNPWSEAETRVLRDLAIENNFLFSIIWHSARSGRFSEKVFSPWNWNGDKKTPDDASIKLIGNQVAERIIKENSSESYQSSYSTSRRGNAHDWFYQATGTFQYLIECGTANLQPDSALVEDTIDRLIPGMLYLLDRAIGYNTVACQITGIISNAETGSPLDNVVITIDELHSGVQKPRKSDEFGRYRRIVEPGTYSLHFRKKGYFPLNFTVTANSSSPVIQNATMTPIPTHNIEINISSFQYPVVLEENPFLVIENAQMSDTIQMDFSHNHVLQIPQGDWQFTLYWDFLIPWMQNITINTDIQLSINMQEPLWVQTLFGFPITDNSSFNIIEGPWVFDNNMIRSQNELFYANADSLDSIFVLESEMYSLPEPMDMIVLRIDQQWELEWDNDSIKVSIMDSTKIINQMFFTGHQWDQSARHRLVAVDTNGISNIKVKLELKRDKTINYRGYNIYNIKLFAGNNVTLSSINEQSPFNQNNSTVSVSEIYPNPSNGMIHIDFINNLQSSSIVVYNLLGQEVYAGEIPAQYNQKKIWRFNFLDDYQRNPVSGVYFIKIVSQNKTFYRKCILLKP